MKIGIISSPGGHLEQSLFVLEAFDKHNIFLISYNSYPLRNFRHPRIDNVYLIRSFGDTKIGALFALSLSFFPFLKFFLKEKPDILFSTGSEIAIIAFYMGKYLFKTKLIFLESITRVVEPSFTAKSVYNISDLFLVQWESMLKKFGKKAQFVGKVI